MIGLAPSSDKDGKMEAKIEFIAHKEKLLKEKISLQGDNDNDDDQVSLVLKARVLGKGKGTPLLRNGIKCVEILPDPDESDVNSDWQGF